MKKSSIDCPQTEEAEKDHCGRISLEEIRRASKKLNLGRAPGKYNILNTVNR